MSVQGNMLASPEVLPAMAQAWTAARGDLPDRLLAALTAGQDAGGDVRGREVAALLGVSGAPATDEDDGVRVDLRGDGPGGPGAQLRVLRHLAAAYHARDYDTLALF